MPNSMTGSNPRAPITFQSGRKTALPETSEGHLTHSRQSEANQMSEKSASRRGGAPGVSRATRRKLAIESKPRFDINPGNAVHGKQSASLSASRSN